MLNGIVKQNCSDIKDDITFINALNQFAIFRGLFPNEGIMFSDKTNKNNN